jgi:uncharacterized membrane protein (UPF0136 family)
MATPGREAERSERKKRLNEGTMKTFLAGADGLIFAIAGLSFGAGAGAMLALYLFVRGDVWGWAWAAVAVLFCFSTGVNCMRLRKMIPAP